MIQIESVEVGIILKTKLGDLQYVKTIRHPMFSEDVSKWVEERLSDITTEWRKDPAVKPKTLEVDER